MVDRWINLFESLQPIVNTARDRRSLITTFVPDMISEGINQTDSLRIFQRSGMGINTADFGAIYNDFLSGNILQSELRNLNDSDLLDTDFMSQNVNASDTRYRFVFNIGLSHSEQEAFKLATFSISSNQNIPVGRLRDMAVEEFVSLYGDTFDFVEGIQLIRAYQNPSIGQ